MAYHLPLSYIQGKYYVVRPITKIFGNDTTIIKVGMQLSKINDIPVHSFFERNRKEYITSPIRWDMENKRFFTENVARPYSYVCNGTPLFLSFIDTATNQEMKVLSASPNMKGRIECDLVLGKKESINEPIVRLIDSILFIKIPSMNKEDMLFYQKEIPSVTNHKIIKKVIIDVRNNGGGSDDVWHYVLSLITDTTLCRHGTIGVNNHPIFNDYLESPIDSFPLYVDPKLNKEYRLLSADNECINIVPDEKSIRFKGKIYVLHNKNSFSAANSLVTFALMDDKLVAVGEPTGVQSGYGVSPFVYKLPYTKLCFVMHSVIHFPIKNDDINNYLWNGTEIPITPTVIYENIMEEYRYSDIYDKLFLYNYDIYFQAVLAVQEQ